MAERKPIFELHIRPMFRLLDRQHMLRFPRDLDLWDYDAVRKELRPNPDEAERSE